MLICSSRIRYSTSYILLFFCSQLLICCCYFCCEDVRSSFCKRGYSETLFIQHSIDRHLDYPPHSDLFGYCIFTKDGIVPALCEAGLYISQSFCSANLEWLFCIMWLNWLCIYYTLKQKTTSFVINFKLCKIRFWECWGWEYTNLEENIYLAHIQYSEEGNNKKINKIIRNHYKLFHYSEREKCISSWNQVSHSLSHSALFITTN